MRVKEKVNRFKNKYSASKKKKIFAIALFVLLIVLVVFSIYFLLVKEEQNSNNKQAVTLSKLDSSTVTDLARKNNCQETITLLSKMDIDKSYALDSGNMLTLRGNCYSELKEYDKAISDFEQAKAVWENSEYKERVNSAEKSIAYNKRMKENPNQTERESNYSPEDELEPEFIEELNSGGANDQ